MISLSSDESLLVVPIPRHPGLMLLCTDLDQYSLDLITDIACQIERWVAQEEATDAKVEEAIDVSQVKDLLRHLYDPQRLAEHPLATHCVHVAPEQRGAALSRFLMAAIRTLEHPADQTNRYIPGTILRMRYIERNSIRQIIRRLSLSERHYYRLHRAGLNWLAHKLEHFLRHGFG